MRVKEEKNEDMATTALNAVDAALGVLTWTRAKLVEAQEENRKLKRIIMELEESHGEHS